MKDHIIALTEAVRLARLELDCFRDGSCAQSAEWTVDRLSKLLLENKEVSRSIAILAPDAESPPLAPEHLAGMFVRQH